MARQPAGQASAGPNIHAIVGRIVTVRGSRVLIDSDLAELYGVETKRLNQQVRRNSGRFPADFLVELTAAEKEEVVANCNHLRKLRFSPSAPLAFTEHGALMAASVLNTPRAVEVSVYVIRAFVHLRKAIASHEALVRELEKLESRVATLALRHDQLAGDARNQFRQVFDALRALMSVPEPAKRPIGFVTDSSGKRRRP